MATAILETYNQTPRKVRLVADLVRGKAVPEALAALTFLPKRAALPVAKLIRSAVANAAQRGEGEGVFVVRAITVESAGMSKRYMPRAFGRAAPVRRRRSRLKVEVAPKA